MAKKLSEDLVRETLSEFTNNNSFLSLAADASLHDNGLDSLAHVKFLVQLEKIFEISFNEDDFAISKTETIREILGLLVAYNYNR